MLAQIIDAKISNFIFNIFRFQLVKDYKIYQHLYRESENTEIVK